MLAVSSRALVAPAIDSDKIATTERSRTQKDNLFHRNTSVPVENRTVNFLSELDRGGEKRFATL